MNHQLISIPILLFFFSTLQAQEFSVAYLGNNLWNPGLNLTIDKKVNKLNHTLDLGIFLDPGSHTAVFATYGLQRLKPKWSFAAYPVGVYRSFLPNTYKVDASGQISEPSSLSGNFYFSPAISIKIRHFDRFYTKAQMLVLLPYNNSMMPVLNIGFGYKINEEKKNNIISNYKPF